MPVWILLVVISQFILAFVSLIDKFILTSNKVPRPIVFAFFVGLVSVLSNFIFLLGYLPIDINGVKLPTLENIKIPDLNLIFYSLLAGYSFILALYFSYKAYKKADASDVVPVVGSVNAVGTLIISYFLIDQSLSKNFLIGFFLLVVGTAFVSHFRFKWAVFNYVLMSGLFFAIHYTSFKLTTNSFGFDNAFFWTRVGMFVSALTLILIPGFSKNLKIKSKRETAKNGLWVIGNVTLGGIAGIMLSMAIDMGDVSIVQALTGLQFVFITIFSFILGKITPHEFGENNSIHDVIQKTIYVLIIIAGFSMLFI